MVGGGQEGAGILDLTTEGRYPVKPYDTKLRQAAVEFRALCQKYDCAGFVLFVSPTHSEYVHHFSPSWSVAKIEGPDRLRFRSKREDFVSKEEQDQKTGATAHMLTSFLEWSRNAHGQMASVLTQLCEHMNIKWTPWTVPDSVPGDGK
jgi:hypothetical protein